MRFQLNTWLGYKFSKSVMSISLKNKKIVTEIAPLGKFYDGEDYHQDYRVLQIKRKRRIHVDRFYLPPLTVNQNPGGYECPTHRFYW